MDASCTARVGVLQSLHYGDVAVLYKGFLADLGFRVSIQKFATMQNGS